MRFGRAAKLLASMALSATSPLLATTAQRQRDGTLPDGRVSEVVVLDNGKGVTARILTFGATLQSYSIPDASGRTADVILGHDNTDGYVASRDFFVVAVGRFANRIARGTFVQDDRTYRVPLNDGSNTLHRGPDGFDRRLWTIEQVENGKSAFVTLSLVSPDGDQGYPGEVTAHVTFALNDAGTLTITMTAQTTKSTVINMTNHALFNMAGQCAPEGAMANLLTIPAGRYTPVDATLIPTGELASVVGTPFDFRAARPLYAGLRKASDPQVLIGRGYDHNWVLDKGQIETPQRVALMEAPVTGRSMEVLSTGPGLQMYTGNFIDGTKIGKGGCLYRIGDGYVLEPQKFPDTPNQAAFGSARLDPGQTFKHVMVLRPARATAVVRP